METNSEMYDLLVEASHQLSTHEKARLATVLGAAVSMARYEVKNGKRVALTWGCPKCIVMDNDKAVIVSHLERDHKARYEMAMWMPVPVTQAEFDR